MSFDHFRHYFEQHRCLLLQIHIFLSLLFLSVSPSSTRKLNLYCPLSQTHLLSLSLARSLSLSQGEKSPVSPTQPTLMKATQTNRGSQPAVCEKRLDKIPHKARKKQLHIWPYNLQMLFFPSPYSSSFNSILSTIFQNEKKR